MSDYGMRCHFRIEPKRSAGRMHEPLQATACNRQGRPPNRTMSSMVDLFLIVRLMEISILVYCSAAIVLLRF